MKAITLEFLIATEEIGVAFLRPCAGGYILTFLEVDSDYRRRGIGSSLIFPGMALSSGKRRIRRP
jgi:GNAT superfamily N-acetyltransferase